MCHVCVTCARESSGHPASSQHLLDRTDVPRLCDLGSKYDIRMKEKLSLKKEVSTQNSCSLYLKRIDIFFDTWLLAGRK